MNQTDYKALRAESWTALWPQIVDHIRQGWKTIGKVDLFDNDYGGTDWVQPMHKKIP